MKKWRLHIWLFGIGFALLSGCDNGAPPTSQSMNDPSPASTAEPPQADRADSVQADASMTSAEEAGWELAFEDDFERDELGDRWQEVDGEWAIENGQLVGHGTLMTSRGYPGKNPTGAIGFQRMAFEATTAVKPLAFLIVGDEKPEVDVSDLSSFLHVPGPEPSKPEVFASGYFFQFGGKMNTRNQIRKGGVVVASDKEPETRIQQDKTHHVVVENDEGVVRMYVDGKLLLEHKEDGSIMGPGFDRAGFYLYTKARIDNVKLYVKKLPGGFDLE